jgi:D-threonine aldolase
LAAIRRIECTCATIRECEGRAAAGLGAEVLLANEVLDDRLLGGLIERGHCVTVAVDSLETVAATQSGGVREVLIDVNVGLRRCGCEPRGRPADSPTSREHGVLPYEV